MSEMLVLFKSLKKEPVFWLTLVLKVIAGTLFASKYLSDMFIPFLEYFAHHPIADPYDFFYKIDQNSIFPYPALMLYVMSFFRFIFFYCGLSVSNLHFLFFAYRLPLLMCDFLILLIFLSWFPKKNKKVLYLYWCSPVLFYVTYLHGQLDIVPSAFLFVALYCLFKDKLTLAAIVFGLALSAKLHLFIALPFFVIFLWRYNFNIIDPIKFSCLTSLSFVISNLPFIFKAHFINMVFLNPELHRLSFAKLSYGNQNIPQFYVIVGAYLVLIFRSLLMRVLNRDLFIMFLGTSFGFLLFFVVPMQGWYFWVIPFFAYFYIKSPVRQLPLFFLLQISYFVYFGFHQHSDYISILSSFFSKDANNFNIYNFLSLSGYSSALILNFSYTLLQVFLIINCLWIYYRGVTSLQKSKVTARAYIIGISGNSGSGKTTLARALQYFFSQRFSALICGDDMHKWQRGDSKWLELTHLDPRANELHRDLKYISMLRDNKVIFRRHYDHDTGRFTHEVPIKPKPIMIFEGLHSFYLKPARELMDLKIFVRPEDNLLIYWKITRDMKCRGYSKEKVLESILRRQDDSRKYITVQEEHADIVVSFSSDPSIDYNRTELDFNIVLELRILNTFFLDPLLEDLCDHLKDKIEHYYDKEDWQVIKFRDTLPVYVLEQVGEKHLTSVQDLGLYSPVWLEGWDGILQLLIVYCVCHETLSSSKF